MAIVLWEEQLVPCHNSEHTYLCTVEHENMAPQRTDRDSLQKYKNRSIQGRLIQIGDLSYTGMY